MKFKILPTLAALLFSTPAEAQSLPTTYDSARDPAIDLRIALAKAQAKKQNVIIDIGGDWCGDCRRLDAFLQANPAIDTILKNKTVFFKVYSGPENTNSQFLSNYPNISWFPSFLILDAKGNLVTIVDTRQLTSLGAFSKTKFNRFISKWGAK